MKPALALSDEQRLIVLAILREHLSIDVCVHAFGSRAAGRVKPWSDLDLVVEADLPLPLSLIAAVSEAFEESALPWKVDVIDRKTVSDRFGRLVDRTKIAFD